MALIIIAQTESGMEIDKFSDQSNCLVSAVYRTGGIHYNLIRFIDRYGQTVFNRQQCQWLLFDLDLLSPHASAEENEVIREVRRLASLCLEAHHQYLRFIGD